MKKYLFACLLTLGMVACSDEPTPSPTPTPIPTPSPTDDKEWNLDQYMSQDYHPGDNFYMHCNGAWYITAEPEVGGTINEAMDIANQRNSELLAQQKDPTLNKFYADAQSINQTTAEAEAAILANKDKLENIRTSEDAMNAIAEMLSLGYNKLLDIFTMVENGKMVYFIHSTNSATEVNWKELAARRLQHSAPEASSLLKHLASLPTRKAINIHDANEYEVFIKGVRPATTSTRSSGPSLMTAIAEKFGVGIEDIKMVDSNTEKYVQYLEQASPEDIKQILQEQVLYDMAFTSDQNLADFNAETGANLTLSQYTSEIEKNYLPYIISHAFTTEYISPALKSRYLEHCEKMRTAFRERIQELEWMTPTTKNNAIEKLDAMKFFAGYPDQWLEEGLPTLTGTSFAEDVLQLRLALRNLQKRIMDSEPQEVAMDLMIIYPSLYGGPTLLTIVNAFYDPSTNAMFIFPAFMLTPPLRRDTIRCLQLRWSILCHRT